MAEFAHQIVEGGLFHYKDCGLDDIWLSGGVDRIDTPYGPATSIHNIDELHQAIGLSIARSLEMNAKEFRFLRVELDLSQRALAQLLRTKEQNIHRWETEKCEIPGTAQVALAGYYLETLDPNSRSKELLEELADLDATISGLEKRIFEAHENSWERAAA